MKAYCGVFCAVVCTLVGSFPVLAQTQADPATVSKDTSCSLFALQTAPTLTARQKSCFYARQIFQPQFTAGALVFAALDEYRNSPHMSHPEWDQLPRRVEIHFARHTSREIGEFLVDALHHEDPRPYHSGKSGLWRRTNAAVMSVLTSPDSEGNWRPAFGPVAGSISSAFVGTMMYGHSETLPTVLTRAGGVYGLYFARAIGNEFKPEILAFAHHMFHIN